MSLVNPGLLQLASMKDSRWLTLEVCREFQRSKCSRTEIDCKFAHPPKHVDVQNGRVVCCYDYIKGKCQRKEPPCKYLHPPQHLREQLLQNGRNNLIIKSIHMQMLSQTLAANGQLLPLTTPFVAAGALPATAQSMAAAAAATAVQGGFAHAFGLPQLFSAADAALLAAAPPPPPPPPPPQVSQLPQTSTTQAPLSSNGLLNGSVGGLTASDCASSNLKLDCSRENYSLMAAVTSTTLQHQQQQSDESFAAKKRKLTEFTEPQQQQLLLPMCLPMGFHGGKRAAVADAKSGIPVYQPGAAASYQQQQQQQQLTAAFQLPPSQQSHAAGAFLPTSWTGDLFQEASCPSLTWV